MTTTTSTPHPTIDEALVGEATHLRHRAESLREQSTRVDEVLATAYRRRASELEMEAWLLEVRAGVPEVQLHNAA